MLAQTTVNVRHASISTEAFRRTTGASIALATLNASRVGTRMMDFSAAPQLDAREQHFRIPGPRRGLSLFLTLLPAAKTAFKPRRVVLYLHGATFPSALSIAHRFAGRSWRDELNDAGFDVWGLDFYGFGHSDRYPEMNAPALENPPLCVAADAAEQVARSEERRVGK